MRHAAWILGYHGCDRDVGEAVLAGDKELLPSQNDYDWLGAGLYFWENSPARGREWAEFLAKGKAPRRKIKHPFVIGAIIDPGNCLDLTEAKCLGLLEAAYSQFSQTVTGLGMEMPQNEAAHSADVDLVKRRLDCAVINFLHDTREDLGEPEFDTVCCPFMEGRPLFVNSRIQAKTHIQWCVRQPERSIIGYFRPRTLAS